ncbi:MAG: hypothetical protein ACK8QZ_12650, partial [Anaerolineales bacterium]
RSMDEATLIALLDSGTLRFAVPSYPDGTPILAGDQVLVFHGEEPGTVIDVIATECLALACGHEYTGATIQMGEHLFYLGMESFLQDPLVLVSRIPAA